jgi:hypothetical protein
LRLLLDEMYPPAIAEQLQARGHDAEAVAARPELRALPDEEIFAVGQSERRAVATENVVDFAPIADRHDQRGVAHHGVIFVSTAKYRRGDASTIGRMVGALDTLLAGSSSDQPTSVRLWL